MVDSVIEVSVVIYFVLSVNISDTCPKLYDFAIFYQLLDAVRELKSRAVSIFIQLQIALGRVERSKDHRLCLAVLQDRVLN